MHGFDDFDLNLLRTLDALLRERSVTKAAARLGRSQPAVSHALARLRDEVGDPLLVRQGRQMVLTPRAEALAPALRGVLADLHRVLDDGGRFDPATSRRAFTLACPDMLAPVVPDILAALDDGPHTSLELVSASDITQVDQVDLVLGVFPDAAPGVIARPLGHITQRTALRRGHPALAAPWSPEAFVAWPHIAIRTGGTPSIIAQAVAAAGMTRSVGLVVPTFLLAAHVCARTDHLLTGSGELLERLVPPLDLVFRDPPLPIPRIRVGAMWRERWHADAGHRWFRRRVIATVEGLLATG